MDYFKLLKPNTTMKPTNPTTRLFTTRLFKTRQQAKNNESMLIDYYGNNLLTHKIVKETDLNGKTGYAVKLTINDCK